MRFDYFDNVRNKKGELCTEQKFMEVVNSKSVTDWCRRIADEPDHKKQGTMKTNHLPVFAFVASFDNHKRAVKYAHPSGLVMIDIDGIDNPFEMWNAILKAHKIEELGIVLAHKTPSTKGLRIVFKGRPGMSDYLENQEWFKSLYPEIAFDEKVKDLARTSFAVPFSYIYYMDRQGLFGDGDVYIENTEYETPQSPSGEDNCQKSQLSNVKQQKLGTYEKYGQRWFEVAQSQELFRNGNRIYETADLMYKGKDLRQIALAWFALRGGVPNEGDRNQGLFELACDLRYITDFNAEKLLACMPALLDKNEVKITIKSALQRERLATLPSRLRNVMKGMTATQKEEQDEEKKTNIYDLLQKSTYVLPASQLPPIFREFVAVAPEDFKKASVVALLPMLGTLGSRLRATYLDGMVQTPSFQCEIEAPMASGKSFANRVDEMVMGNVRKQDAIYRKKEQAYQKKVKAAINKKEQPEVETYPIRIINPTTSVAALLERQMNVGEVHLYSFTDEIKVVLDSMKRGSYGDLRALMRNAFDNQYFGQDYKGDKSTNTMCRIYFNTLHCGTPAEYRKFYDNSEDGTISRILFAELPDQSFKEMPKWKALTEKQKEAVEKGVQRLSEVTMKDDKVQPEHVLDNLDFLNQWAANWLTKMRLLAKEENNRSLDTFRRRAAVVGFRAGMLAWFLYGKNTKLNQQKTIAFAEWIAEYMLVSLLHRYKVSEVSNIIYFKNVWNVLGDEFSSEEVEGSLEAVNVKTPAKTVIWRWKEQNLIEKLSNNMFKKKRI